MTSTPHSHVPDLHVVALHYRMEHGNSVSYDNPEPIVFDEPVAAFQLRDGKLRAELKLHFSEVAEARANVEPFLRAWELDSEFHGNPGDLSFRFECPEVIDRAPKVPGVISGFAHITGVSAICTATATVTVHHRRKQYPKPPTNFSINPDVESLALRFRNYRQNREPLQSMAYFCLTVVEGGDRKQAAQHRGIEYRVLSKIGELCAKRGDRETARKAEALGIPLTGAESEWLQAAVKELVFRVGDTRPADQRPTLKMSDLPPL